MNPWSEVHHLFETDDGSLPDIYIENVTEQEKENIYNWVMSLTQPSGNPTVWSIKENMDVPLKEIKNPVKEFIQGNIESYRVALEEFNIDGTTIPQLSICVGTDGIEFDYRMGKEWGNNEVKSLFSFLSSIRNMARKAKIFQAYEGEYESPNREFTESFERYYIAK